MAMSSGEVRGVEVAVARVVATVDPVLGSIQYCTELPFGSLGDS